MKTKVEKKTRNKMLQDISNFAKVEKTLNCESIEDFETESRKHLYNLTV